MCCGGKLARLVLVFFNVLVFLCGLVVAAIAVFLKVATGDVIEWITNIIGSALDWALLASAFYLMIGVGIFLMFVGFLGCCGAIRRSTCMLTTYIIIVIVLLTLQILGGILAAVFLGYLNGSIEHVMKVNLQNQYGTSDVVTSSWDNLQYELDCCGGESYLDYKGSHYYNTTQHAVPKSCCTLAHREGNEIILDEDKWNECKNASEHTDKSTLFYSTGCYDTFTEWLTSHTHVLLALMGLGVFQLLSIFMACCVIKHDNPYTRADEKLP